MPLDCSKRQIKAIDNLKDLKPELRRLSEAQMDPHVQDFETKILDNADAYSKEVRSRRESVASSRVSKLIHPHRIESSDSVG